MPGDSEEPTSGIAGGGTLWHGRFAGGPSDALMAFTVSLPWSGPDQHIRQAA